MTAAPMIIEKLRYVHQDLDRHGNVRIYFWRGKGHPKIRIREQPGTPAFRAAYDAAFSGPPPAPTKPRDARPSAGTFRWLCVSYFASAEFRRLDSRTQAVRRGIVEHCCREPIAPGAAETFAEVPLERFTSRAVRVLRDRKADFPEAANGRVKAIRQVFAWGLSAEPDAVAANPARDVPYLKAAAGGFHAWTVSEVRQFEERHPIGTKARLALALLLFTSQRRSDVILFGRQHVSNGWLHFTQFKNRNVAPVSLSMPVHPQLQAVIDATPSDHMTFLVTEFGKPFTAAGFGNWFRKRCDEAGLKHCSAHGLRKAAAALLAEGGASDREIMAVTGHRTSKEVDRYTRSASQKRLAGVAITKLRMDEG